MVCTNFIVIGLLLIYTCYIPSCLSHGRHHHHHRQYHDRSAEWVLDIPSPDNATAPLRIYNVNEGANFWYLEDQQIFTNFDVHAPTFPVKTIIGVTKSDDEGNKGHDKVKYCINPSALRYQITMETMFTRTADYMPTSISREMAHFIAPIGIAAYADWVFVSNSINQLFGVFGTTLQPQVVFVHTKVLPIFINEYLSLIKNPFILLTACNDHTIPKDVHSEPQPKWDMWNKLMRNEYLVHWFVENLDTLHAKASPLPIGNWYFIPRPSNGSVPLDQREFKLLVTDKVHDDDPDFVDRATVSNQCVSRPDLCHCIHRPDASQPLVYGSLFEKDKWVDAVSSHVFHICVHGGGLDPSTKAWETIEIGTIPIIEHSTLDEAYTELPVVFVNNVTEFLLWSNLSETMKIWYEEKSPFYVHGSALRKQTLHRLKANFWANKITSKLSNYDARYSRISEG
jgi:hypothetical protein